MYITMYTHTHTHGVDGGRAYIWAKLLYIQYEYIKWLAICQNIDRGRFLAEWKGSNNIMSQRDPSSSPSGSHTQHLSSPTSTMTGEFHSPIQWCLFSLYLHQFPMFPVCLRGRSVSGRSASSCRMYSSHIKQSNAPALGFMLLHAGKRNCLIVFIFLLSTDGNDCVHYAT